MSPNGAGGVPSTKGLTLKSNGLRPPRALIVPDAAVELTAVVGVDGRLAAYLIDVVLWAGMKLFWPRSLGMSVHTRASFWA